MACWRSLRVKLSASLISPSSSSSTPVFSSLFARDRLLHDFLRRRELLVGIPSADGSLVRFVLLLVPGRMNPGERRLADSPSSNRGDVALLSLRGVGLHLADAVLGGELLASVRRLGGRGCTAREAGLAGTWSTPIGT